MKWFCIALYGAAFLLCAITAPAQEGSFTPLQKDTAREATLLQATDVRYLKDVATLEGSFKKYTGDIYRERHRMIREKFTGGEIITDPGAQAYLDALVNTIAKANPSLPLADLRILFSRSWWPNASSMGEGTILFNIGLFNRLHNESQAAFVLCHELAHYFLDHGNNNIRNYVNLVYADGFGKEKAGEKPGFRPGQQVLSLVRDATFNSRRHGRAYELAADSMALVLMKNTGYDLTEALECLALLDIVDEDKYASALQLEKRFDFSAFRFKKSWLQSYAPQFGITRETVHETVDSLKTHPDCKARIGRLEERVAQWNRRGNKKFLVKEERFRGMQHQFDFEILQYCFESQRVSRCLYFALQMLPSFPHNVFLHTTIGKCLNELYARLKANSLVQVVDKVGPDNKEAYNELLLMIRNLSLPDIAALAYYYLLGHLPAFEHNGDFAAEWNRSRQNFRR